MHLLLSKQQNGPCLRMTRKSYHCDILTWLSSIAMLHNLCICMQRSWRLTLQQYESFSKSLSFSFHSSQSDKTLYAQNTEFAKQKTSKSIYNSTYLQSTVYIQSAYSLTSICIVYIPTPYTYNHLEVFILTQTVYIPYTSSCTCRAFV